MADQQAFKDNGIFFFNPILMFCYFVGVIVILVRYYLYLDGIREPGGENLIGRDFLNFWSGGRAAIDLNIDFLYNIPEYCNSLRSRFGESLNDYVFSYPPHSTLMLAPFGALPYFYGFLLWSIGGIVLLYAACRQWFKNGHYSFWIIMGPAGIITILGGQTGFLIGGLWVMALALLERRPILSGVLIGLLTVKPQIGVLLALFLVCQGYWKVIIAASVTTVLIVGSSFLLFGLEPWNAFIHDTLPFQSRVISFKYGVFDDMVHTPFKWVINLTYDENLMGNVKLAWLVQIPFMVFGFLALIWASRKSVDKRLMICLLSLLTFLFSPYMAIYDMTILTFAVCLYMQFRLEKRGLYKVKHDTPMVLLAFLLIFTPIIGFFASVVHIPLSVVLMCILLALIIRDIHKTSTISENTHHQITALA